MPGVNGVRFLNCLSLADCGVSAKLYHSNSWEKKGANPCLFASATIFFNSWRGQTGEGSPFWSQSSPTKKGASFSHGIFLKVFMSIRTGQSGEPVCQPVYGRFSYSASPASDPNIAFQNLSQLSPAEKNFSEDMYDPRKMPSMSPSAIFA